MRAGQVKQYVKCMRDGCDLPAGNRGLCCGCYQTYYRYVKSGKATWEQIEEKGLCRKSNRTVRRSRAHIFLENALSPSTPESPDVRQIQNTTFIPRPTPDAFTEVTTYCPPTSDYKPVIDAKAARDKEIEEYAAKAARDNEKRFPTMEEIKRIAAMDETPDPKPFVPTEAPPWAR
jgi:hypothetical protein